MTEAPTRLTCQLCGRSAAELAPSAYLGAVCCERCAGEASAANAIRGGLQPRARRPKPAPEAAYALLVRRVWRRIEERTGWPPAYLARDRIGVLCPVGCGGTLAIRFVDPASGPEVDLPDAGCSGGCTVEQITEALL